MTRKAYSLLLPACVTSKMIKTHSIKAVEDILREGLATIPELPEPEPSPSPRIPSKGVSRKVSMQQRSVSVKLIKRPEGGRQIRVSKFSTIITAPLATIGHSYVRMMNGLAERGSLGEVGMGGLTFGAMAGRDLHGWMEQLAVRSNQ